MFKSTYQWLCVKSSAGAISDKSVGFAQDASRARQSGAHGEANRPVQNLFTGRYWYTVATH